MTELQIKERYERKAYRIVQYHIKDMLLSIPLQNVGIGSYEMLISSNITEEKVKAMLVDLYYQIGKLAKKRFRIDKPKNLLFNDEFLQEVLNFLNSPESGAKILSIQQTLIKTVVEQIKPFVSDEISLAELRDLIYRIGNQSSRYYKWQALRIAVTETTTASNFAKFNEAKKSNLHLLKFWVSLNDDRVRHDHVVENGQSAELDEPFVMADGKQLMYAGDPQGGAGQVINCRCTIRFEAKRDKDGNLIYRGSNNNKMPEFKLTYSGFENVGFNYIKHTEKIAREFNITGNISLKLNRLSKNKGGGTGWKLGNDGIYGSNRQIELQGDLTDEEIKGVIYHEMRHVWQMQSKTLEFKGGFYYWEGKKILSSTTYQKYVTKMAKSKTYQEGQMWYKKYRDTPWEVDAHNFGDPFSKKEVYKPADILEPAEWNGLILESEKTELDKESENL